MESRFYTSSGDDGYTGVLGAGRVAKETARIEALGTIDEATAALGMARALCKSRQAGKLLLAVQRDLYHLMAEISATPENAVRFRQIDASRVTWLEEQTDSLAQQVETPREFILPGDTPGGAALDLARAVVRRAERRAAGLLHQGEIENPDLLRYLNRLSSLCFVLELVESRTVRKSGPTLAKLISG